MMAEFLAGLYDGIRDATYHADPVPDGSLSVSGAKLVARNPARWLWDRKHRTEPVVGDLLFGKAVHSAIFGGPDVVHIRCEDWRSSKNRAIRDEHAAAGRLPLKTPEFLTVKAMRTAVRDNPRAAALLDQPGLRPEVSAFRQDDVTGRWLRARFDLLTPTGIVDYKTAENADPEAFRRYGINYGYHWQAAWYLDMAAALGRDVSAGFQFIVQEKEPPFHASVVEFDPETVELGRAWNRYAINRWHECLEADDWPAYPAETVTVAAMPWAPRPPTAEAPEPDDRPALDPGDVFAYLNELNEGNTP